MDGGPVMKTGLYYEHFYWVGLFVFLFLTYPCEVARLKTSSLLWST
jgi:hypothetical protein